MNGVCKFNTLKGRWYDKELYIKKKESNDTTEVAGRRMIEQGSIISLTESGNDIFLVFNVCGIYPSSVTMLCGHCKIISWRDSGLECVKFI